MITTVPDITIESSGIQVQKAFTIKASRKAFNILSSGLYSDKKLAIVREVLCNAQDSHVAAHNLNPVLVHLPNSFEPYLSIQDSGTGLSHESVMTLYPTYFESTKTESNDFTGCLGLGSKSPFSYVDSFTVVSRFGGVKSTYNAFIGEDGCPSIARLHEEPTSESNGLEVTIPVKHEDFEEFCLKLQKVVRRFKVLPKVVGNQNFVYSPITYKMTGDGWGLREEGTGAMIATMGNVGYPMNLVDGSLTTEQEQVLKLPIDVHFGIGELDITPSRESLSFDAATVATIKAKLDAVISEIRSIVSQKFAASPSLWAARCLAYEVFRGEYKQFSDLLKNTAAVQWQGQNVAYGEIPHNSPMTVKLFQNVDLSAMRRKERQTAKFRLTSGEIKNSVATLPNTVFVFCDLNKGAYVRCQTYIHQNPKANLYLIQPAEQPIVSSTPSFLVAGMAAPNTGLTVSAQLEQLAKTLGVDSQDIIKASSLYQTPRAVRQVSDKGKARFFRYKSISSYTESENWEVAMADLKAGGVYVVINRFEIIPERGGQVSSREYLDQLSLQMKRAGVSIDGLTIYGVKRGSVNKLAKLTNWKTLTDYCREKVQDQIVKTKASGNISDILALRKFRNEICRFDIDCLAPRLGKINPNKTFGKLLQEYAAMKACVSNIDQYMGMREVATRFNVMIPEVSPSYDLPALYRAVLKTYPMMKLANTENTTDQVEEIIEYINFLD